MTQRITYYDAAPDAMKIMMDMENTQSNQRLIERLESLLKLEFLRSMAVLTA